jgi:hypothetical protein
MLAGDGAQTTIDRSGCPATRSGAVGPAKLLTTRLARRDHRRIARRSMPGATDPASLVRPIASRETPQVRRTAMSRAMASSRACGAATAIGRRTNTEA